MKLTVEQKPLLATIKRLQGVVETRQAIPILGHFHIQADEAGTVTIKATDLDIEATATIAASVQHGGSCTVQAKTLSDIIGKLASGALVSIDADSASQRVTIAAGRSSFELASLDPLDFPHLASADFAASFIASGKVIADIIGGPLFAASTEETKYYLNGVYLHPVDGNAIAVATDGHKLGKIASSIAADFPGVIVPRKTCAEVMKSLSGNDDDVEVSISDTKIRFATQHFTILSKVVDGTFPAYDRVIPKAHPNSVSVSAAELAAAVDRVASVTDDKTRAVKLAVTTEEIAVSSRSATSKAQDAVSATLSGQPVEIGFNGAYLSEILKQCDGEVILSYADNDKPALFQPAGRDATFLLMPMRVV